MSNLDLWTIDEANLAHAQGWKLCDVYDLSKQKLGFEIFPAANSVASTKDATSFVVARARTGDALAIKALKLLYR